MPALCWALEIQQRPWTVLLQDSSRGLGSGHSPNPGKEAAEEESAITLDER